MPLRHFFLLFITLSFASCKDSGHNVTATIVKDTSKQTPKITQQDLPDDSSYDRFMDSFISKKDIVFSTKKTEAGEDWFFDKEWGPTPVKPRNFFVGKEHFLTSKIICVNGDDDFFEGSEDGRTFEVDSAVMFSFKNKKYAWVTAHIYNCNGTGCLAEFQMIADFQHHRLHLFSAFALPFESRYFGDVDGDGRLDFLLPEIISINNCGWVYCDTNLISLTPYTLNDRGYFEQKKNGKSYSVLVGQFYNGLSPRNFKIVAEMNWPDWDKYRQ